MFGNDTFHFRGAEILAGGSLGFESTAQRDSQRRGIFLRTAPDVLEAYDYGAGGFCIKLNSDGTICGNRP